MDGQTLNSIQQVMLRAGGISRSKVYQLIAAGQLKPVKIGRRTFVPETSLQAFFNRLTEGGAA
jgi:excisionase family DNA binding protein